MVEQRDVEQGIEELFGMREVWWGGGNIQLH